MSDSRDRLIEQMCRSGYTEDAFDHMTEYQRIGARAQIECELDKALSRPDDLLAVMVEAGVLADEWNDFSEHVYRRIEGTTP